MPKKKDDNLRLWKDSYFCFVCHESGDSIKFIEKLYGMGFLDAEKWISEQFGLGLFDPGRNRVALERRVRRLASNRNNGYGSEQYEADRKEWNNALNAEKQATELHRNWIRSHAPKDADGDWNATFDEVRNHEEMIASIIENSEQTMASAESRMDRWERS